MTGGKVPYDKVSAEGPLILAEEAHHTGRQAEQSHDKDGGELTSRSPLKYVEDTDNQKKKRIECC